MDRLKLHPEAKTISFRHKVFILNAFQNNIQSVLGIDHFSLMIVDAQNEMSIYSSSPSLEFSLISESLWDHDGIFKSENHQDGAFYFWDELYSSTFKNALVKEKETKLGFLYGFCVMKQMKDIFVIYSFATRSEQEKEVYKDSKNALFKIGDCLFNALESIHCKYVARQKKEPPAKKSFFPLRLIIDNTKRNNIFLKRQRENE